MWKDIFRVEIPNVELLLIGSLLPYVMENEFGSFIVKSDLKNIRNLDKGIKILLDNNYLSDCVQTYKIGDKKGFYFLKNFEKQEVKVPKDLESILDSYSDYLKATRKEALIGQVNRRITNIVNSEELKDTMLVDYYNMCAAMYNEYSNIAYVFATQKEKATAKNILKKADKQTVLNLIPFYFLKYSPEKTEQNKNIFNFYYNFDSIQNQFKKW